MTVSYAVARAGELLRIPRGLGLTPQAKHSSRAGSEGCADGVFAPPFTRWIAQSRLQ